MTDDLERRRVLVGLVRVRDHCTFTWRGPAVGDNRSIEVLPSHCEECIAEVRARGFDVIYTAANKEPEAP